MRSHYDILQIQPSASPEVIKGAYRYLARKWHPDNNPDDRERALGIARVIKQAYLVLSDPELRHLHDKWLAAQQVTVAPEADAGARPEAEVAPEPVVARVPEVGLGPEVAPVPEVGPQPVVVPVAEVEVIAAAGPGAGAETVPAQAQTEAPAAAPCSAPFVLRLYRGDVALVVSYWIFGVLIGLFVFNVLIINPLEDNYAALALRYGDYFHTAIYAVLLALTAFFYLAIWNSAGKYGGPRYYAYLARGSVVASATVITFAIGSALVQVFDEGAERGAEVVASTQPYMIDDDTRMDGTTISGNEVHHHYTLVRIDSTQFDARAFSTAIQPRLAAHACADLEARALLEQGGAISYNYANNDGRTVSQVEIKSAHCQ